MTISTPSSAYTCFQKRVWTCVKIASLNPFLRVKVVGIHIVIKGNVGSPLELLYYKLSYGTQIIAEQFHYHRGSTPKKAILLFIISLLMSPLLGHRPSLWITHKENGPLLPKDGETRDNKFLVTHPTDQRCLTSAITR
jgi:hypothetical protein